MEKLSKKVVPSFETLFSSIIIPILATLLNVNDSEKVNYRIGRITQEMRDSFGIHDIPLDGPYLLATVDNTNRNMFIYGDIITGNDLVDYSKLFVNTIQSLIRMITIDKYTDQLMTVKINGKQQIKYN